MSNLFRDLTADEIDVRIGSAKENGVSLLLYKDARADMNILDETYGAFNWKREHTVVNGNLFATVCLWDNQKSQWVCKQDVGTESNTEKEKGESSDSFKRACFNWGIGRKLYSSPFIWVSGSKDQYKYEKFKVLEIEYDNKSITKLVIGDSKNNIVFTYPHNNANYKNQKTQKEEVKKVDPAKETEQPKLATPNQLKMIESLYNGDVDKLYKLAEHLKVKSLTELTQAQAQDIIKKIKDKQALQQ